MQFPAISQIAKAAVIAAGFAVAAVLPATAQEGAALPKLEGPAIVTSMGQSLDAFQVQLGVRRAGIDFKYDAHFEPDSLATAKSLILVVGASLKGFGEAGISIEQERERAHHFITEAQAKGIPILMVHPGGAERRDGLSNQLIEIIAPASAVMIIRTDSDADMRFHTIAMEKAIPLVVVENVAGLLDPLKLLYGIQ